MANPSKDTSKAAREQTPDKKRTTPAKRAEDTEFADELTQSDIQSAFKNPVTGEERLY